MVWIPGGEAVPLPGPTIGDQPWVPGQGFAPGSFYYPSPRFVPAEEASSERRRHERARYEASLPATPPVNVPEPSGALVLIVGMAGVGALIRQKPSP